MMQGCYCRPNEVKYVGYWVTPYAMSSSDFQGHLHRTYCKRFQVQFVEQLCKMIKYNLTQRVARSLRDS